MTTSADTAALLDVGDAYFGDLDGPTDAAWIRAELTAGATYELTLTARDPDAQAHSEMKRSTPPRVQLLTVMLCVGNRECCLSLKLWHGVTFSKTNMLLEHGYICVCDPLVSPG